MKSQTLCSLLSVLALAACGGLPSQSSSAVAAHADSATPTLTFGADWSVRVDPAGPLPAGGQATILYDTSRLATFNECSPPGPGLNLRYSVDGGPEIAPPVSLTDTEIDGHAFKQLRFTVPEGNQLSIWYVMGDRYGQCGVDSNESANYVFDIAG